VVPERIESHVPELSVEVKPIVRSLEPGPVDSQPVFTAVDSSDDEPRPLKYLDVLGHAVQAHRKRIREICDLEVARLAQEADDLAPGRVGESPERSIERAGVSWSGTVIINHGVEYTFN